LKQQSAIREELRPVMFVLPIIQGKKLFRLAALCGDSLKGSLCPSEHDEPIVEPRTAPPITRKLANDRGSTTGKVNALQFAVQQTKKCHVSRIG